MAEYNLSATLALRDKFTGTVRNFKNQMKNIDNSSRRAEKRVRGLTGSTRGLYSALGGIGVVAGITKAVKSFASLEVQNVRNRKIIGATKEEYKKLEDQQKSMAKNSVHSSLDVAKAQEFMARAGWNINKILGGTAPILDLVTASGEDLATISDMVTDQMDALGLEFNQLEGFGDSLLNTSNSTNASVLQLGEALGNAATSSQLMGEDFNDLNAILGTLANKGLKGAEAGTAMKMAYKDMAAPNEKAAKMAKKLGLNYYDMEGNFRGFIPIMKELKDKTSNMTDEQKNFVLANLFTERSSKAVKIVLQSNIDKTNEMAESNRNAGGAVKEMAGEINDTTDGAIKKMTSSLGETATALGSLIGPSVVEGLSKLTGIFEGLTNKTDEAKNNIDSIKKALMIGGAVAIGAKIGGAPGAALGAGLSSGAIVGQKIVKSTGGTNEAKAEIEIQKTRQEMARASAFYKQQYGESSIITTQKIETNGAGLSSGAIVRDSISKELQESMLKTKAIRNVDELKRRESELDYKKRYGESSIITIQKIEINGAQDPKKVLDEFILRTREIGKTQ